MNRTNAHIKNQGGYSLVEVLVCLAISALVAALIFASLGTQVRQVETLRAVQASAFNTVATDRMLTTIISNTIAPWPEEAELKFRGTPENLQGLSDHTLLNDTPHLQYYTVALDRSGSHATVKVSTEEGQWTLSGFPESSALRYLGWNDNWYEEWPPAQRNISSLQDMEENLRNTDLPRMVAVIDQSNTQVVLLSIPLPNSSLSTVRSKDLMGTDPAP